MNRRLGINESFSWRWHAKLWMVLNLLDVILSWAAIRTGAFELNMIARIFDLNFWGFVTYKLLGALIIAMILSGLGKTHMLRHLDTGMVFVCSWNSVAILLSVLYLAES